MVRRKKGEIPEDDRSRPEAPRWEERDPAEEEEEENPSRGSFGDRLRRDFLPPGGIISAVAAWARHHRGWVCGGCGVLFLLVVAVPAVLYFKGSRSGLSRGKGAEPPAVALQSVFTFDHFTIDLQDPQGNYRLLICDVVLELNRPDSMTEERKVAIRKTIYETARRKSPDLLGSSQAYRVFKRQIGTELGNLLGPETIREVYVTKFVLL